MTGSGCCKDGSVTYGADTKLGSFLTGRTSALSFSVTAISGSGCGDALMVKSFIDVGCFMCLLW